MNSSTHTFFATAAKGLEPLIADELQSFSAKNIQLSGGGVSFNGSMELAYRMCLWSRVANRILLLLKTCEVQDMEALYDAVYALDWSQHFGAHNSIAVDFVAKHSFVRNSLFGAQKTKDAIVDQFQSKLGQRPNVDLQSPDIRINMFMKSNRVSLSLDLSGHSLHQRGYRQNKVKAPIKENLAAAILRRAGWPDIAAKNGGLLDPMCGSGTFLIEAALMAANIAPGLYRRDFGFTHWKQHDASCWNQLLEHAQQQQVEGLKSLPKIFGYDRDPRAIKSAKLNIRAAGLEDYIDVGQQELSQLHGEPNLTPGLILTNPPYGERLSEKNHLPELFELLGNQLKSHFSQWKATILCADAILGKRLGMRSHRIHTIYNGPIECKLLHFNIDPQWFFREPHHLTPDMSALENEQALMFKNRLEKNLKRLKPWIQKENIQAYRAYDADLPNYNVAVDVYHSDIIRVNVQEYQAPKTIDAGIAKQRLREALAIVGDVFHIPSEQVFVKIRQRQRQQQQYEKFGDSKDFHIIEENGGKLLVNLKDYLDTGLFLDHRPTRLKIQQLSKKKRFLNLFCYTGAATVHAALGGATYTCSVDMSQTYIQWAGKNLELNGFALQNHELIQADCLQWLRNSVKGDFDLIFMDPPTFSNSKRMNHVLDIQRDHGELIQYAMKRLKSDGMLLFSTNFRKFQLSDPLHELFQILKMEDSLPPDFRRNGKIHQCWQIRHK
ncbi:MAG: bifunctional 23S rRNA (guanine(2069)-N(7))-methyltransferase RlmK/23S rRNA (guanine(2445)-N(2))-methyltransferase RlmL [Gammaproteobacteria bacterium]|nr:bifunctional 23S rRNA (guanine(2069)-N(7))-methyltransferase RlmK/23S rRNA (guanine(2445)-N(2))-methyltransferase RlmL [Gammaproteobacteria bacterium]MDH5801166.1 bifunctional 23S rRNA (guanine(2069)-N(7))-methyltransferase RlmK/23S rRNA (guanine(2445)-N(2))-methyltransferase RlmL [Gammaproteobacteria bacterium]